MKCPECQFDNSEDAKFCNECGNKLDFACSECGKVNALGSKFCNECGQRLDEAVEKEEKIPTTDSERKHVTVLFSDLSGYTAMTERLDPEEVKEIMSRIFGEITQVITKYEGFIERFIGDAVMAVFGVPKAHEDDPVRAIRAAREIHELVEAISPEFEEKVGRPLSMHSGINTGLVVTGEIDVEKGTHGITGDTINLASRFEGLAKAGEIVVGQDTYRQAEGYFDFEELESAKVKGKAEPVQVFRVLSAKERPVTVHRLSGLRANLIGRKVELDQLEEAVENLREGKGSIFSICGDAGTGKSRLVEEFKSLLDLKKIQWLEGRAYPYTQNIPYFPLTDMLNRVFQIEEGDSQDIIKQKIESGVVNLVEKKESLIPYVGSLYSLHYPEIGEVSPEFWKSQIRDVGKTLISALAHRTPTVFLLEDLHWADPSFGEFLRDTLLEVRQPAIVLCVYRPTFNLFTSHQLSSISNVYREIRIQDLSPSEAQDMLQSLLKSESIPTDLQRLVQDRAEGNPFYLEELVNSLIETETLIRDNGSWKVTRSIGESEISSTIHGIISGRLDRLEREMKRVLQEASVIGRTFLHEILRRITDLKDRCELCISGLERLDLIRTRSLEPELEYFFKHALTQEVVYNGLLKKERREIHERTGLVMEELFQNRLPEFYETLAFHFRQGRSIEKAVDYLIKSGEKSLNRFALDEAHQYYQQAYDLLSPRVGETEEDNNLLFYLLDKWALVFYYYGTFRDLIGLFRTHGALAESFKDKGRRGMFYAWLGMALWATGKSKDSYEYLRKALNLGEESGDSRVIGYACTWLPLSCVEMGILDEGIEYGEKAKKIADGLPSEQYLYYKSRGDLGYLFYFKGYSEKALAAGKEMIEFGENCSNIRSQAMGHGVQGWGYLEGGDYPAAISSLSRVEQITVDPFYATVWSTFRAFAHFFAGQIQESEAALVRGEKCMRAGTDALEGFLLMGRGLIWLAKGSMGKGMNMLLDARQCCLKNEWKGTYAVSEYVLGKAYMGIALGEGEVSLSTMLKNIGFLLKTIPFAARRAESHFTRAVEAAREIGSKGTLAKAHLNLGNLHKAKGRTEQARKHVAEAIQLFEECENEIFLKQAREAFASLG